MTQNNNNNSTNFLFLQQFEVEPNKQKYSNQQIANQSCISNSDGIKIYIRAIARILEHIEDLRQLHSDYSNKSKLTTQQAKGELSEIIISIGEKVEKIQAINNEFIRGLSVTHDINAKDFMTLIYDRIDYAKLRLDMFRMLMKSKYLDEAVVVYKRTIDTFERMLSILEKSLEEQKNQTEFQKVTLSS